MDNIRPLVVVPQNEAMAEEPARVIGGQVDQKFTGKDDIKLLIAAVLAILAAFGIHAAPDVATNIETIVTIVSPIALAIYARWQTERTKSQQAAHQAEATRDAVYAPATVATIVQNTQDRQPVPAVVIPGPGTEQHPVVQ
jgi:hypothetical protein